MPNSESYSAMRPLCPVAAAARPAVAEAHPGLGESQALKPWMWQWGMVDLLPRRPCTTGKVPKQDRCMRNAVCHEESVHRGNQRQ